MTAAAVLASAQGLSPRVRGKLANNAMRPTLAGSIPACAGEAPRSEGRNAGRWVYPRVCGGSRRFPRWRRQSRGLSPRVRGKRRRWRRCWYRPGSIPACAGEAPRRPTGVKAARVYPRVCGGSGGIVCRPVRVEGLSPRVRGKHPGAFSPVSQARSIPACAGEAGSAGGAGSWGRVYPRVCGGSSASYQSCAAISGLSPRVRGKRVDALRAA